MNKNGPILIIEDDSDDRFLLNNVFGELSYTNEISFFENSVQALEYLTNTDTEPFLIISDLIMPGMSGLQLREAIQLHEKFRLKDIPYIIFTASKNPHQVHQAYSVNVQGYFAKPISFEKMKVLISTIVGYWQNGVLPNQGMLADP